MFKLAKIGGKWTWLPFLILQTELLTNANRFNNDRSALIFHSKLLLIPPNQLDNYEEN